MEPCDDVFDYYAARILSGLIVSKGIGPIWSAKESDYERLIKVAFEMTELVMHKRELRGLE